MEKPIRKWSTHIPYIKPFYIQYYGMRNNTVVKSVKLSVPNDFSEDGFANILVPDKRLHPMKPKKDSRRVTWYELKFRTYLYQRKNYKSRRSNYRPMQRCKTVMETGLGYLRFKDDETCVHDRNVKPPKAAFLS